VRKWHFVLLTDVDDGCTPHHGIVTPTMPVSGGATSDDRYADIRQAVDRHPHGRQLPLRWTNSDRRSWVRGAQARGGRCVGSEDMDCKTTPRVPIRTGNDRRGSVRSQRHDAPAPMSTTPTSTPCWGRPSPPRPKGALMTCSKMSGEIFKPDFLW